MNIPIREITTRFLYQIRRFAKEGTLWRVNSNGVFTECKPKTGCKVKKEKDRHFLLAVLRLLGSLAGPTAVFLRIVF